MSDPIRITMFGGFQLTYGTNSVSDQDNRSKKVWTLLKYLITFHDHEIHHNTLTNLLWSNSEGGIDSENALKTILHRARTTLSALGYTGNKLILHHRETYCFNPDVSFILDIDQFEEYCEAAGKIELPKQERLKNYRLAFSLYKGRFLPNNSEEDWVIPVSGYYHSLYLNAVHESIELLLKSECLPEITALCFKTSEIDPYDETARYHLIRSLYLRGKTKEALDEYRYVIHLFYDTYGINPSDKFIALYREITQETHSPNADLSAILTRLREQNIKRCPYFCDFSVFQNLYHIEARSADRNGQSVFLCLITLTTSQSDHSLMAAAMAKMADTIEQCLRAGDACSRYSVNQYVIMLSAANYENCMMIGSRIIRTFQNAKPKLNITADYVLSELEPSLFEA